MVETSSCIQGIQYR